MTKNEEAGYGLVLAVFLTGAIAQGAEPVGGTTNVVAGGSAAGAGEAFGVGALISTNAALIAAGVLSAGPVAAGSKTQTTTSH